MTTLIRLSLLAISLVAPVYTTPLSTSPHYEPSHRSPLTVAPLSEPHHGTINNSYIVMLRRDLPPSLTQNHLNFLKMAHEADPLVSEKSGIQHVYNTVNGYAGYFTDSVIEQLRSMPEVDYIERDQVVHTMNLTLQKFAPWGLARISHRPKLTISTFNKYEYDRNGGEGVDVYVIDTGINIKHVEFEGRASWGKTIPNDVDEDGNGHGSHCAGTIASSKYGVAKSANVIAVKVLGSDGSGQMIDVVGGVDWASQAAAEKAEAALSELKATGSTKHKGSVANMSLGGSKSKALDDAVNAAVDSGLHFAVAAGNDNKDACKYSPAAAAKAVTVGAIDSGDNRAYFSNHGPCVDIFAPGVGIVSTYKGSNNSIATLSGTSMASPHTAGLLAYLLSLYPSEQFNPIVSQDFPPVVIQAQRTFFSSPLIYGVVNAILPRWASELLSSKLELATAPTPKPPLTLTPAQLKKALIALGSTGLISDIPPETVNLIAFNNATRV